MPAEEALFYAARRAKDAPRILQHYFEPPRKNTACAETPANGRGAPLKKQPAQPWRCLWLLFLEQITMTLPFLLIILHLSHIGFTEGLTFIINLLLVHEILARAARDNFREFEELCSSSRDL